MTILIVADHDNRQLNPETRSAISAGVQLGPVHVLVAGFNSQHVVQQCQAIAGVEKVLWSEAEHYADFLAEELAPLVVSLASNYSHILAPANAYGKNLLPRVAALLDCAQVSDVVQVIDTQTFIRPIYAGNVLARVRNNSTTHVLTVRPTAFTPAGDTSTSAPSEQVAPQPAQSLSQLIGREFTSSDRPELSQARVVVSGGRGLGSAEQFEAVITPLADALQAAIGASRAAVDAGYAPNDWQVGQTGKVVAPDLYIAVGISGAIQHLAGMQGSKVIVAINQDPDAPIFQVADYGLVADLFQAVPELVTALQA